MPSSARTSAETTKTGSARKFVTSTVCVLKTTRACVLICGQNCCFEIYVLVKFAKQILKTRKNAPFAYNIATTSSVSLAFFLPSFYCAGQLSAVSDAQKVGALGGRRGKEQLRAALRRGAPSAEVRTPHLPPARVRTRGGPSDPEKPRRARRVRAGVAHASSSTASAAGPSPGPTMATTHPPQPAPVSRAPAAPAARNAAWSGRASRP